MSSLFLMVIVGCHSVFLRDIILFYYM
jgi:hypothetical protein